jgi:FkbM family methyltransferase
VPGRASSAARRVLEQLQLLLHDRGVDVVRSPFSYRVVHAMRLRGITDVLDVGANTGQFASALRKAHVDGKIVSVEPLRDAVDRLRSHAASDPFWVVEHAAVSSTPGEVTMNVSANSVSSSVLPMLDLHADVAPASKYVTKETVPATTVDDLVQRHALTPERTMLKIDVQGHELAVLDGAVANLPRFGAVRCELSLAPLYDGQALMPEIIERLDACGLDLWVLENGLTDPASRRVLQFDGTFFRRL